MKITAALAIAVVLASNAAAINLRATAAKFLTGAAVTTDEAPVEARLIVHGLLREASPEDIKIISDRAVEAFNAAYGKAAGLSLTAFDATFHVPVSRRRSHEITPDCRFCPPDDDTVAGVNNLQAQSLSEIVFARLSKRRSHEITPDCRFCPPDDDAAMISLQDPAILAHVHRKLEMQLCDLLQKSGSANLAHANSCTFEIMDVPGVAALDPIQGHVTAATEGQFSIQGTVHALTASDLGLIEHAVSAAYGDAFYDAGYAIQVQALEAVSVDNTVGRRSHEITPDCRFCPPDDDALLGSNTMQLVLARVSKKRRSHEITPDCRFCPPDDDTLVNLPAQEEKVMHVAFEKAVCAQLQRSGAANFVNAHSCRFNFVHSPVGKTASAQE